MNLLHDGVTSVDLVFAVWAIVLAPVAFVIAISFVMICVYKLEDLINRLKKKWRNDV